MKKNLVIFSGLFFFVSIFSSFNVIAQSSEKDEVVITLRKKVSGGYEISKELLVALDCSACQQVGRFLKCNTTSAKKTIHFFKCNKERFLEVGSIEKNIPIEITPLNFNNQTIYDNDTIPPPGQWSLNGTDDYNPGYWQALDSFGVTGDGIKVAIIDATIKLQHPDLRNAIWQNIYEDSDSNGVTIEYDSISGDWALDSDDINNIDDDGNGYIDDLTGWNFIRNDKYVYGWSQWGDHGTHVAGIVGAQHNDIGIYGSAPGATIVPVVIMSSYTAPSSINNQEKSLSKTVMLYDLIKVFTYASSNADIINCSWRSGSEEVPPYALRVAVEDATSQGVLVVTAAGNDDADLGTSPIHPGSIGDPGILNVGCLSANGDICGNYSSIRCDGFAAGLDILSLRNEGDQEDGIGFKSGSSMAAPLISGYAALLMEHHRNHGDTLTGRQIKQILMCSVIQSTGLDSACVSGGYYNLFDALSMPMPKTFEITVCLEGAYDTLFGGMRTDLINLNLLPDGQPYDVSPWNYSGDEGRGWKKTDYPSNVVDWVLVSFRADTSKESEFLQVAALLEASGEIDFSSSGCELFFDEMPVDSAYIVIEHRNHMGIMTPHPVYVNGRSITHDFRITNSYTGGETGGGFGQKQMSDSTWAMFVGDADQSDLPSFQITGSDKSLWFDNNGIFGQYLTPDFNLDGDVNGGDKELWIENNGISSRVPK